MEIKKGEKWVEIKPSHNIRLLNGGSVNSEHFEDYDLNRADLRFCIMHNVKFKDSDIRDSDLRAGDFKDSDMRNVDFRGSDLRYASFENVDLRGSKMRCAKIESTDFTDANLEGVEWI